jgi:hypothetical protein
MVKKNIIIKLSIFTIGGAASGFAYYYFVGCRSGSCPLTSNPFITTVYGSLMGLVLGFDSKLFRRSIDNDKSQISDNKK